MISESYLKISVKILLLFNNYKCLLMEIIYPDNMHCVEFIVPLVCSYDHGNNSTFVKSLTVIKVCSSNNFQERTTPIPQWEN